jgi:hypothetical protein
MPSSLQDIQDPATRRVAEEILHAIEATNQRIGTTVPEQDTVQDTVQRFDVLTRRAEFVGGKLRLYGRTMGYVNGKLEALSSEHIIKEVPIKAQFTPQDITSITNITNVAGDTVTGNTYYTGWPTE